jgi:hypothetical protein
MRSPRLLDTTQLTTVPLEQRLTLFVFCKAEEDDILNNEVIDELGGIWVNSG